MVLLQLTQDGDPFEQPYAFTAGDFIFLDEHMRQLHGKARCHAAFVRISWRTQTNLNNGETKLFAKASDARVCPVLAALRMILRYERIGDDTGVIGLSRRDI